jgi:competence protein ComEC
MFRPFFIFIYGFIVAVFVASFFGANIYFGLFFAVLGGVLFLSGFVLAENKRLWFFTALFVFAFGTGFFWYGFRDARVLKNASLLKDEIGAKITFDGIISDEPEQKENYTRLIARTNNGVKILLTANKYPEYFYGDRIKITGVLKKPEKYNEFDWPSYLAKEEIFYEIFYPKTEFVSSGNGNIVKEKLLVLKKNFTGTLDKMLPEPHSALLNGVTVGARSSLPKDLTDEMKETGVIHIVVLSGYNISIVAENAMALFSFLPAALSPVVGIIGVILFAVFAGASATVVRASIMAGLVVLARASGRLYKASAALVMAGFFMVFENPKILVFDSGFQLSFMATLALIYFEPVLEKRLKFLPEKFKIREITCSTLAAQTFVLPLLLYKTGLLSLVALPANLLIIAFVPLTMFFGFLTGGLGIISYFVAVPFSWISFFLLEYEISVVRFFAGLPFSSVKINYFPAWVMAVSYIFIFWLTHKMIKKDKNKIIEY